MTSIWNFIQCLPGLIKLFQILEAAAKEAETERKTKEDLKTIHDAFTSKDSSKLNALFNSK